eukprot:m.132876 g.132876  ORF g.132876 m.132876 type:complete len:348 (+) comp9488_c0_seq51:99-1142(+)
MPEIRYEVGDPVNAGDMCDSATVNKLGFCEAVTNSFNETMNSMTRKTDLINDLNDKVTTFKDHIIKVCSEMDDEVGIAEQMENLPNSESDDSEGSSSMTEMTNQVDSLVSDMENLLNDLPDFTDEQTLTEIKKGWANAQEIAENIGRLRSEYDYEFEGTVFNNWPTTADVGEGLASFFDALALNDGIEQSGLLRRLGKKLALDAWENDEETTARSLYNLYLVTATVGDAEEIVYIGRTTISLKERFKGGHTALVKLLKDDYDQPYNLYPVVVTADGAVPGNELICAEQIVIRKYQPVFNAANEGRESMKLEDHDDLAKTCTCYNEDSLFQHIGESQMTWAEVVGEIQ